jgi:hypothetical protein
LELNETNPYVNVLAFESTEVSEVQFAFSDDEEGNVVGLLGNPNIIPIFWFKRTLRSEHFIERASLIWNLPASMNLASFFSRRMIWITEFYRGDNSEEDFCGGCLAFHAAVAFAA